MPISLTLKYGKLVIFDGISIVLSLFKKKYCDDSVDKNSTAFVYPSHYSSKLNEHYNYPVDPQIIDSNDSSSALSSVCPFTSNGKILIQNSPY